jgi:SNF2 family DNA or RNA helicase
MWHDAARNLVIYETFDPRPEQYIPDLVKFDGRYMAVPASLKNLQIMRLLGFPVIRPLANYGWPRHRKVAPTPFFGQTETANFFAVHPRASCLSPMGAGKTLSVLWAGDALMRDYASRGERIRGIVVAPLSTLQSVWMDALETHFMGLRKGVIVHGSAEQRLAALAQDVDWYIINHDGIKTGAKFIATRPRRPPRIELSGFAAQLAARTDIRIAAIDEVGSFRDHRTNRSRVAKHLLAARDYFWVMTGTPTPNAPTDAYGIGKLLNNCFGESFTSFKTRTMAPTESKFKYVPRPGAHEEAMKLLAPSIRFPVEMKVSLSIQNRDVPLSPEQLHRFRELKRELLIEFERDKVKAVNSAALRTKLLQICCGSVYDENHKAHDLDVRPRIAVLKEIIEEAGKVLIFAPFTSSVNLLNSVLSNVSKEVITGETTLAERTRIMRAFQQEDDPRAIIANAEPISRGQTLTAACVIVWWGPVDKCETYIQANYRIFRPGQTRNCTVVNLCGSPVEKETYRRLAAQESMQGLLLKLVEMGI